MWLLKSSFFSDFISKCSLFPCLCSSHSRLLLFFQHTGLAPGSGSSHWLFLLPRTHRSWVSSCLIALPLSDFYPDATFMKSANILFNTLPLSSAPCIPFFYLFFTIALITSAVYILYFVCWLLSLLECKILWGYEFLLFALLLECKHLERFLTHIRYSTNVLIS